MVWFRSLLWREHSIVSTTIPDVVENVNDDNLALCTNDLMDKDNGTTLIISCKDEISSLEQIKKVCSQIVSVESVEVASARLLESAHNYWNTIFGVASENSNELVESETDDRTLCDETSSETTIVDLNDSVEQTVTNDYDFIENDNLFSENQENKNTNDIKTFQDLHDLMLQHLTSIGNVDEPFYDAYPDSVPTEDLEALYQQSFEDTYNIIFNYTEYYMNRVGAVPSQLSKAFGKIGRSSLFKRKNEETEIPVQNNETKENENESEEENSVFMNKFEEWLDSMHQHHNGVDCKCEEIRLLNRQRNRKIRNKRKLEKASEGSSQSSIFLSETELFEDKSNSEELKDFKSIRAFFDRKNVTA